MDLPPGFEHVTAWRQHLHAHPELGRQEAETARFVCERLREMAIPFTPGVGGHGVVATLSRGTSNRSVGLRADMDALPITEETGLPYASSNAGVMHACGHDGHTASLLGAAMLLQADPGWTGTVQFVFQPAEEGLAGAAAMIADGLFERFPMERIFGYHNWPGLQAGTVALHDGPVMASGSKIEITVEGHAGHAAMPHLTRDPMVAAAHLLIALQTVVSRNIDPLDNAVLSICTVNAGVAPNQIPARVSMTGTCRSYREEVHDLIEAGIARVSAGVGQTFGVSVAPRVIPGVCATVNTLPEVALAHEGASSAGLPVRRDLLPAMTGEDFGWYLHRVPGAFAWVGNGPAQPGTELHNPGYNYNDAILPAASAWLASTAKQALQA